MGQYRPRSSASGAAAGDRIPSQGAPVRVTVRIALFAALSAALGFLLAPVPNVELLTFSIFVGGSLMGARAGVTAALLAAGLYFGLNPYGSSLAFPLLFLAQLIGASIIALLGALHARLMPPGRGGSLGRRLLILPFAALAALQLPLLPSLAFMVVGGGAWQGWAALGLLMTLGSLVFNLLVFGTSHAPLMRQAARLDAARSASPLGGGAGA
jgi:hypothetical protein